MIRNISIENYKSIQKVDLSLGRFNVFIGENGSGKSNILEAIALASAAEVDKLDNEFLASRGIRVTDPKMMRSGFNKDHAKLPIRLSALAENGDQYIYSLSNDNKVYSEWANSLEIKPSPDDGFKLLEEYVESLRQHPDSLESLQKLHRSLSEAMSRIESQDKGERKEISFSVNINPEVFSPRKNGDIEDFVIFSPENSALRTFEREGQILPLGVNGEGLLKLLSVMSQAAHADELNQIKDALRLLNWFEDFSVVGRGLRSRLKISDHFLDPRSNNFDQRSANEGFLFVTFYFALFASKMTPRFFAVDNIDASLNPKLCQKMIGLLSNLSIKNRKQVLLTTHNPAILDGIDLTDDDQRLFIVSRGKSGETKARRFNRKKDSKSPMRLSELFMSGALGGLPKSF